MEDSQINPVTETVEKSKFNPLMLVGVVVLVAVGGIVLVMSGGKNSTPTASTTPSTEAAQVEGVSSTSASTSTDIKTFDLEAGSFYYKPNEIRVKQGDKVKIVMSSKDMMHDFNIDELKVKLPITKAGASNSVEFTADKTGTFEFYCSVGQHRAHGQVGKLIVE